MQRAEGNDAGISVASAALSDPDLINTYRGAQCNHARMSEWGRQRLREHT